MVVADLLDDDAGRLAAELGDRALATHLDVTSQESWAATVDATLGAFGTVDVLVNNAGIANAGPIDHYPLAKWDAVIAVNLTGVFLGVQAVVPTMKAAGAARSSTSRRSRACSAAPTCTATWRRSSASGA